MAASDARPVPRKNTAFRYYFALRKSDGTLVTSWAGQDSEVSLDGASYNDCTNEATEVSGSGSGYLDLTAAEMNADAVLLKVTVSNSNALPLVVTLFPEEAGDYRTDMVMISGDATAADNLESYTDGTTKMPVNVEEWDNEPVSDVDGVAQAISNSPPSITLAPDFQGDCTGRSIHVRYPIAEEDGDAQVIDYDDDTKIALVDKAWPIDDELPEYTFGPYSPTKSDIATATTAALVAAQPGTWSAIADLTDVLDALDALSTAVATLITNNALLYNYGTTTGTPTTTSIQGTGGDLSSTNDKYLNKYLQITSGALSGERKKITGYVGSSKTFTTLAFSAAPASGVSFVVLDLTK